MSSKVQRNGLVPHVWCGMALVIVLTAEVTSAQDKLGGGSDTRIQAWIQGLASTNKSPPRGDGEVEIPGSYNREAQVKVLDAWEALLKEGVKAFPLLVANAEDRRYSCTWRGANGDVNLTVGIVCRSIIKNQIEVLWDVIDYPYPGAAPTRTLSGDMATWWKENRHRTLRDLQIEATQVALTELKNPSEREIELRKLPSVKDRQLENIRRLEILLDRLKATDRAILPKSIEGSGGLIGLPGRDPVRPRAHPYERDSEAVRP